MPASTLCLWHECTGCDNPLRSGDLFAAHEWVSRFVGDEAEMARLRVLAGRADAPVAASRAGEHDVAEQIAACITAGSMRVCGSVRPLRLYRLVGASMPQPAPAAPAAAAAAAPRAAPAGSASPALPQATFVADLDAAAMAQALRAAARDGVPFCEECERARQAAARAG